MTEKPWLHIAFAPRDGRFVRVKCEEGMIYRARFRAPDWWVVGDTKKRGRAAYLADDVLAGRSYGIDRAIQFQELS